MPNETEDYNNFVRANLPAGMSYSANRYRYNNHSFYVFELAAWYYYYLLRVNSPSNLFSASEVGVWYDPSDLTTLFQDSAGTTPVTAAGQPVGLMLDKSKSLALGAELVSNGDFSNGTTGWTLLGGGTTAINGAGQVVITVVGSYAVLHQSFTTVIGKTYKVTGNIVDTTGAPSFWGIRKADNADPSINVVNIRTISNGPANAVFVATATTSFITLQVNQDGKTATFDNISVKEIAGNHATQATAAQRPTYGIHPYSGVRNLLRYSEQFDTTAWAKNNVTVVADQTTAPDGTLTADLIAGSSSTSNTKYINGIVTTSTAGVWTYSVWLKKNTQTTVLIRINDSTGANGSRGIVNLDTGVVSSVANDGTATGGAVTAEDWGDGWWRVRVSSNFVSAISGLQAAVWIQGYGPSTSTNSFYFWGAQLETGSTATAYQKTVTQYEVTEAGVPSVHYIGFDGVDDGMVTSAIDFSATNKMTVFVGLRKLSDATLGVVAELTQFVGSFAGSFTVFAPATGTAANYGWRCRGNGTVPIVYSPTTFAAPDTAVFTGIGNISGDIATLRIDGVQVATDTTTDQGTGNFANAILYIGRRGGSSLPFNGNIYSLIVRGAQSTDSQITNTETWVNQKTGAY